MVIGDGEFVFGGGKNLATVLDKSDHSKAYSANGGDPGWCRRTRRERLARWCYFPKRFQADLPRPAPSERIFRFRRRANQFYQLAPSFPGKRGVSRSSRTRDGMRWTRQRRARKVCRRADLSVSGNGARTTGARLLTSLRTAHGPSRSGWRWLAYGKTVWSWHPLLVLSRRRRDRLNRA